MILTIVLLAYVLAGGIWWSIMIRWEFADIIRFIYYFKTINFKAFSINTDEQYNKEEIKVTVII